MVSWKRDDNRRRRGAAAGERGSVAALERDNVQGCQCEVIDCHPLLLSLLLTHPALAYGLNPWWMDNV